MKRFTLVVNSDRLDQPWYITMLLKHPVLRYVEITLSLLMLLIVVLVFAPILLTIYLLLALRHAWWSLKDDCGRTLKATKTLAKSMITYDIVVESLGKDEKAYDVREENE